MWSNFRRLMTEIPFLRYLGNTVFVTASAWRSTWASSAVVAYGFAKIRWPGRETLFYLLLATMVLPPQVTLIPQFVLFQKLGWVGTFLPLVVPPLFGSAFAVFLLRQFYAAIPEDISDSARIDGAVGVADLHADHPAAVATRAGDGVAVHLHLDLDRLPQPADLPHRRSPLHPGRRPAAALQHARGRLAAAHGGVAAHEPADHRALLLRPEDVHRGRLDRRPQGLTRRRVGARGGSHRHADAAPARRAAHQRPLPALLAEVLGWHLEVPEALLGSRKRPGDADAIVGWLRDTAPRASAPWSRSTRSPGAGLIPSRQSGNDLDAALRGWRGCASSAGPIRVCR
jgi:hypothetical protein